MCTLNQLHKLRKVSNFNMAALYNEIVKTLQEVPEMIQNGPIFNEIQKANNELPIYRSCFQMKLIFMGNSGAGKSTIINALLKRDCLETGSTEVTVSFFTIETTKKDHEYSVLTNRKSGLTANEITDISILKSAKRLNYNVIDFPNIDTTMKIYLDKGDEFLKNGVVLVDCPGYNRGHFDTIKDFCKDTDVITVVIDITEGCTEIEAGNVKQISQISENGPISFIFNKCDHISSKDKERAMDTIKKLFPNISKYNCTDSEKPVFFLSARELFPGKPDGFNAEEFERYKRFIRNQMPIAKLSHQNGCVTLASKIKKLADKIEKSVPLITNKQYRNTEETKQSRMNMTSHLSDKQIKEIFEKIDQTVNANDFICYKDKADTKVTKICDDVNKMISEFLQKSCLNDNKVIITQNGHAVRKAKNIFFSEQFVASQMKINDYSWYNSGEKTAEVQTNFKNYVSTNESNYKDKITSHYEEKVGQFLDHVLREREENIKYMETLRSLVPKLLQNT